MPPHLNVVSKPVCVCVCVCIHLSVCLLLITSQHMVHRPPTVAETLPSAVRLSGVVYWLKCNHRTCLPSPPVDMIIVWRLQGKIIRTVLCCVVYDSCAQWYTHTYTHTHTRAVLKDECWFVFRFSVLCFSDLLKSVLFLCCLFLLCWV